MGALTQGTDRLGNYLSKRGLFVAAGWLAFALVCWIIRGTVFGWFITPTLANLFGIPDASLIGGSSENNVALEDLALLVMAIFGFLCSVFFAVIPSHVLSWRRN